MKIPLHYPIADYYPTFIYTSIYSLLALFSNNISSQTPLMCIYFQDVLSLFGYANPSRAKPARSQPSQFAARFTPFFACMWCARSVKSTSFPTLPTPSCSAAYDPLDPSIRASHLKSEVCVPTLYTKTSSIITFHSPLVVRVPAKYI